jgi:arylsulfatase A-like enzyme
MLPVWQGKTPDDWRKYVYYHYYESGGEHNVAKHVGVRSDKYKLIYYYENGDWELYDLQKDPNELNNVYNNPAYTQIQQDLKKELNKLAEQYKDTEVVKMNIGK